MTTVLTVGGSDGTRRCDATCHNAKGPNCDCVCGGRYHGKGQAALTAVEADVEAGVFGPDVRSVAAELELQEKKKSASARARAAETTHERARREALERRARLAEEGFETFDDTPMPDEDDWPASSNDAYRSGP